MTGLLPRIIFGLAAWVSAASANGYEQVTHAWLTRTAIASADAVDPSPSRAKSLGLDGFHPFGETATYFESISLSGGPIYILRKAQDFEIDMAAILGIRFKSDPASAWLLYGSVREDDNPTEDPPTPQDVAPGLRRPLNHFFDPAFNRGLTAGGLFVLDPDVHKNPDWAIGAKNSFTDPNTPEVPRANSFTVFDARESMFRALTLMTYDGAGYTGIAANRDLATRQQWRQAYWGTTFRALGHVLHLNQDMAQPQHTRNEPHSGQPCPIGTTCLAGHASVYEKYIKARTIKARGFNSSGPFNVQVEIPNLPLREDTYPIPAFGTYTAYWSTSPGDVSLLGAGLADYSNRGFFTAAKNFGSTEYPYPSSDPSRYVLVSAVPTRWDGSPVNDATPISIFQGEVLDDWQQTVSSNVPLTTLSLWDQFIRARTNEPSFSLNRLNYDAMASLLIPRAVAYSAGLINFFFRGRIDIELPDEGVFAAADHSGDKGFTTVRAKIGNRTPTFMDEWRTLQPQDMSGGQFFAVIRYHRDKQYVAGLDTIVGTAPCASAEVIINAARPDASTQCRDAIEQIVVSRPLYGVSLKADEQRLVEFEFDESPIPFDMTDVILQVVYRGELGSEADAVAVGTADVSEPTYFTYHNASDYIHIGDHVYTRGEVNADVGLLSQVQPQHCVDYAKSPAQLIDGCLDPFPLDLAVSFGDTANPIASVTGLPNHRFIRLVYLTASEEGFNPPVKGVKRAVKIDVRPHRHDGKAMLNQEGTCIPHDPFNIPPRHAQMSVVPPNQVFYRLGTLGSLRGVNGWYSASCVVNGDDSVPGAPDDRAAVMTPLVPLTDEVIPYRVTIMPAYL